MIIDVFNADDHPMLRKGVSDLIVESEGLKWVGSAENGLEAYDKIKSIVPDVAILDIEMPVMTGLETAQKLINEGISTRFVLLTLFKDESFLKHALEIGVKGYLLKESSTSEILKCIHYANEGKSFVNAGMTQFIVERNKETNALTEILSAHEVNILKLISRQKTSSQIADMLFISPKTVSNHRTNISKKLQLDGKQNGLLKWALNNQALLESM